MPANDEYLLPCPFCGNDPKMFIREGVYKYNIVCSGPCGMALVQTGSYQSLEMAIKAWNTRTNDKETSEIAQ